MGIVFSAHVNDTDTVVTVTAPARAGDKVSYSLADGTRKTVVASGDIPQYHKMAVFNHRPGDFVYKYGAKIGIAAADIAAGDHVHTHNLRKLCHEGEGTL